MTSSLVRYLASLLCGAACTQVHAAEPVALQVETLTVPPATQPLLFVAVRNLQNRAYGGSLTVQGPEGWRLAPASRPLALAPGETKRIPFTIEQGRNLEANTYAFELTATGDGAPVKQRQETFVASAPSHPVTVDGQPDEWDDAIPVTFATRGQRTTVSTYWNRRKFALLVAVQERELVPYSGGGGAGLCDAVQFALAPLEASGAQAPEKRAGRHEFLVLAAREAARCFRLASPDTAWAQTTHPRPLEPLAEAEVAVRRTGDTTCYECSLPFKTLGPEFRPSEGAEFYCSVLIHDPDGTGLRDLGQWAGAWPADASHPAWSRWPGDHGGDAAPALTWIRWGLCASKY